MQNEYGLSASAPGAISMTKVKNAFKKQYPNLTVELKNARVNGQLRGCYGFVTDPATGNVVYLNTETTTRNEVLYRTAAHNKDYTGGTNRFCDFHELADEVHQLLGASK